MSASAVLLTTSCGADYFDMKPNQSVSTENIFETTDNVKLAVNGLAKIMTSQYLGTKGFNGEGTIRTFYGNYPGNDYQKCNLTGWDGVINSDYMSKPTSKYDYYPWYYYYKIIANANAVICRTDEAAGDELEKMFLKAQALTFRAYAFSQLVQLYAKRWMDSDNGTSRGVVLRLDESKDDMPTSTLGECYAQIYQDLDDAINMFVASGKDRDKDEKYLPNLGVAYAVYAKAALNREDWETAATYAKLARQGYVLMSNEEYLDGGFNTCNDEWIWEVYSSEEETLYYYQYFAYEGSNSSSSSYRTYPAAISKELFVKIPSSDVRRSMFLDPKKDKYTASSGKAGSTLSKRAKSEYSGKLDGESSIFAYMQFKQQAKAQPGVGEFAIFRAAEMYLIEAEADYHLGKEEEAQNLLMELNKTSGRNEKYTCTMKGDQLLDEVRLYYRIEMWGEGRDWFNYKRWGLPIERHTADDGGSFHAAFAVTNKPSANNGWTWVIPSKEIDYNSDILTPDEK